MYVCMYVCMYVYIYIYIHSPRPHHKDRRWAATSRKVLIANTLIVSGLRAVAASRGP